MPVNHRVGLRSLRAWDDIGMMAGDWWLFRLQSGSLYWHPDDELFFEAPIAHAVVRR